MFVYSIQFGGKKNMASIFGGSKQNKEKQLVQAKVDKDLYAEFRELKQYRGMSVRGMFEHFMRYELTNYQLEDGMKRRIYG